MRQKIERAVLVVALIIVVGMHIRPWLRKLRRFRWKTSSKRNLRW